MSEYDAPEDGIAASDAAEQPTAVPGVAAGPSTDPGGDRPAGDPPTWPGAGSGAGAGYGGYGGPAPGYGGYGGPPPGYGGYGGPPPGYGGWGGGWAPPAGPGWGMPGGTGPSGRSGGWRPGRRLLGGMLAVLTALAILVGVGIGYSVWNGTTTAANRTTSPASPRFGFGGTGRTTRGATSSTSTGQSGSRSSAASGSPSDISSIASKVDPELVDVNTVLGYQTGEAAGTGQVLTSNGLVLTNNHVIEGATKITATDLGNGKTYTASVVGYDRTQDVAVIQLQGASGLQTTTDATSAAAPGEAVVGIGNAGGLGGTPATAGGSVTALNQSITASDEADSTTEHLTGLIETNAHIEAGDSGGPLVDSSGQVLGMDTAASAAQGFTFQGQATGQGYAIPITTAMSVAKQIESGSSSSTIHIGATAFIGVTVKSVGQATSTSATKSGGVTRFFGRTTTTGSTSSNLPSSGAYVVTVLSGTPAQQAGLGRGDVITKLGNTAVTSPNSLSNALIPYHPGDKVSVQYTSSSGQTETATLTLASGPAA